MKKALIISNSSGLITDFLENDIKILKEKGYEIECACNVNYPGKDTKNFFEKFNIFVHDVSFPIRNLNFKMIFKSYSQIKNILKKNKYDLIHCHSTIASIIGRECGKKYRKNGTKIFYTSHGFPFYKENKSKKALLFKMIENYYSKYTDALITICNEDYINAKSMKCKKVYKINGVGVELDKIFNCKVDIISYKKKLGISENENVILSIGELNTNKNHKIIIDALKYLKNIPLVYLICGREVTEIGKKKELENLAKKNQVKVIFLGFRKDIAEIVHCADIGAIPSFKEGLGLAGIEMLAAGIPVVGSDRQGIKDYIINNKTGFLCNPNSVSSFSKGIKCALRLIKSKQTSSNCIEMSKKFSKDNSYNLMKTIYEENLNN